MILKRGFKQLMAEANAVIETITVQQAMHLVADPATVFVDIRERHEVERTGMIKGASISVSYAAILIAFAFRRFRRKDIVS